MSEWLVFHQSSWKYNMIKERLHFFSDGAEHYRRGMGRKDNIDILGIFWTLKTAISVITVVSLFIVFLWLCFFPIII